MTEGYRNISVRIICIVVLFVLENVASSLVVTTDKGKVEGLLEKSVWNSKPFAAFRGIPYARPPYHQLRFKPPVEPSPWNHVLKAHRDTPACPQEDYIFGGFIGDEDCLYLNVFTPQTSLETVVESLPVMVWIHPGFYVGGYANSTLYGPDFIIEENVILVTLNYRLGALGFLSLDHPDATGNTGLKDVEFALQWVHNNIAKFGGDNTRVTVFGQGSGGVIVDLLMLSDSSANLFQNTISMSGSLLCPWAMYSQEVAVKRAWSFASALGYTHNAAASAEKLLDFLYTVPARKLVAASNTLTRIDTPWKPTVENPAHANNTDLFITECPMRKYAEKRVANVPHMMGFMEHEGLFHASEKVLSRLWNISPEKLSDVQKGFAQFLHDYSMVPGIDLKHQILRQQHPSPIYYYQVSFDGPYSLHNSSMFNINAAGATHFDDVGYLFHTSVATDVPTEVGHPLSSFRSKMVKLWTNFAKYGNPTPLSVDRVLFPADWEDSRRNNVQCHIDTEMEQKPPRLQPITSFFQLLLNDSAEIMTGCPNPRAATLDLPFLNAR